MTDQPAQNNSYVNDYVPPKAGVTSPTSPPPVVPTPPVTPSPVTSPPVQPPSIRQPSPVDAPAPSQNPFASAMADTSDSVNEPMISEPPPITPPPVTPHVVSPPPTVSDTTPRPNTAPTPVAPPQTMETSQKLEDQNIFFLLGVEEKDASSEQRESFLDELQQVIWEDFLESDVQLLLTKNESAEFKQMLEKSKGKTIEDQEEIVVYLEKLIPDLEEIMLEKALELKADMVKERVAGMKQRFASEPEKLKQIEAAEQDLTQDNWFSLAKALNSIK
jgi:hypothetical protein